MPRSIVIVDTEAGELAPLAEAFAAACGDSGAVRTVTRVEELVDLLEDEGCDLVLVDRDRGDGIVDGVEVLTRARRAAADLPIVFVAEEGNVDAAQSAIASGATDFLVRSHRLEERAGTLLAKIKKWIELARENRELRRALDERHSIVGTSPQIADVLRKIHRVAKVPRPVLVLGERGTGKELVARAIHDASEVPGPFVVVNCAAIADTLLESELFGHERGAFTGAERRATGKFELAQQGTLFLDEIGHMSLAFQQKILRAVEYGTFLRVGGTQEVVVQTRIVAATNADLGAMIRRGEFSADLHDRLAFEEIRMPALRERSGDVAMLAQHFLERFVREVPAFRGKRLSARAMEALARYGFPGNVRELKNIIERAVYRETEAELTTHDLGLSEPASRGAKTGTFKERIEAYERELIDEAIEAAGGNQAEAARRLGLSYHQLRYYRSKHR